MSYKNVTMKAQEKKYLYVIGKCNLTGKMQNIFLKTLQVNIDQIRVKWESLCDV